VFLHLYIQISISETCNSSLSKTLAPKSFSSHISLFFVQITPHKAQTSSFFNLFHLNRLKFQKISSNGGTIKEAKGHFKSESTTFWVTGNTNSLLHSFWIIVFIWGTADTVHKPLFFSFHYRPKIHRYGFLFKWEFWMLSSIWKLQSYSIHVSKISCLFWSCQSLLFKLRNPRRHPNVWGLWD